MSPPTSNHQVIIVMTRLPRPGKSKTRLIPALGPKGASAFHDRLAKHTIGRASSFTLSHPKTSLQIHLEGGNVKQGHHWLGSNSLNLFLQSNGDLGERMFSALQTAFTQGAKRVIIIGTDCPSIDESVLKNAFKALQTNDVVFGPAHDGGYYLIGVNAPHQSIFQNIPWGGDAVLKTSLLRAHENQTASGKPHPLKTHLLPPLSDVDHPEDLENAKKQLTLGTSISVIIPTFNEEDNIANLIKFLETSQTTQKSKPLEIIVSDGGSTDNTTTVASTAGAHVITAKQGRANQMNQAAHQATGEFLLFLHADTTPPENFQSEITKILQIPNTSAGAFQFKLDDPAKKFSIIELGVRARCLFFNTPYGDQGFFVRRHLFTTSLSFPEWNVLEDLEWINQAKKIGKLRMSETYTITSSRRWKKQGYLRTFFTHQLALVAYFCGVSHKTIAKLF